MSEKINYAIAILVEKRLNHTIDIFAGTYKSEAADSQLFPQVIPAHSWQEAYGFCKEDLEVQYPTKDGWVHHINVLKKGF